LLEAVSSSSFGSETFYTRKPEYIAKEKIPMTYPNGSFNFNPRRVVKSRCQARSNEVNNRSWMVASQMIAKNQNSFKVRSSKQGPIHASKLR
jgi:hypothetical protein